MAGLLIVNADDWGSFRKGTDDILETFHAGAITSATAMVYMKDSRRAALLANEHGLPVGLHLNLTLPFDSPDVPDGVRDRHGDVCKLLGGTSRFRRWAFDPRRSSGRLFEDAIADQYAEFVEIFGKEPTHLDSHQHVHGVPTVLLRLPRHLPVRRLTSLKAHVIAHRFTTTDRFHAFRSSVWMQEQSRLERALAGASTRAIEVMVHPTLHRHHSLILEDAWRAAVARYRVGTYADLDGRKIAA